MWNLPGNLRTRHELESGKAGTDESTRIGGFVVVGRCDADSLPPGRSGPAGRRRKVSVWSGVYTAAQNKRGEEFHASACAQCHGSRLNGAGQPDQPPSPAIAGTDFLRKWSGQTVAALFLYVRKMMPSDNPGSLSDQESIDAVAHMFAVSEMPAGDKELPPDLEGSRRHRDHAEAKIGPIRQPDTRTITARSRARSAGDRTG